MNTVLCAIGNCVRIDTGHLDAGVYLDGRSVQCYQEHSLCQPLLRGIGHHRLHTLAMERAKTAVNIREPTPFQG